MHKPKAERGRAEGITNQSQSQRGQMEGVTNQRQRCQMEGVTNQRWVFIRDCMHKPKAQRGQTAGVTSVTKGRERACTSCGTPGAVNSHKPKAERPDGRCNFSNQRQREGVHFLWHTWGSNSKSGHTLTGFWREAKTCPLPLADKEDGGA